MRRAPLIAVAAALCACNYDRAFTDYCVESGACSCVDNACCVLHSYSCRTEYPCCEGLVCAADGACRRPADAVLETVPAVCDLGWIEVGQTRTLTVAVRNAGRGPSSPLVLSSVGAPFRLDVDGCSGQVLAPGASCSLQISAAPTSIAAFTDFLRIEELVSSVQLPLHVRSDTVTLSVSASNAVVGSIVSDPPGLACPPPDFSPCTAEFHGGTQVTLSRGLPLGSGYYFQGFYGGGCYGGGETCSLSLDDPRTVWVSYVPNLMLNVGQGGAVTVAGFSYQASSTPATYWVPVSGPTTLTELPQPPNHFAGWGGACAFAGLGTDCTLSIYGPVTVSAGFTP